jgi:methylene-fatty-acyl-phospholipid synthase
VTLWVFLCAAALLSVERICYLWIWRAPDDFRVFSTRVRIGDPVDALRWLFYCFKVLQGAVFGGWCFVFGDGSILPLAGSVSSVATGAALIAGGQILNIGVFYRLGKVGVFYGDKFGYAVPWCQKFPFSLLDHPQYVGTLLSIWGFFFVMRFPHDDWYLLPALETVYYILGAYFER